jgi:hypothetical protein
MSYDLAVWEGDPPTDDVAGLAEMQAQQRLNWESPRTEPTPAIRAYVDALLKIYPDLDPHLGDDDPSPWSTSPLIQEARGSFVYFPMTYSRSREVSAVAARLARSRGLVCFDPQLGLLRPALAELAGEESQTP